MKYQNTDDLQTEARHRLPKVENYEAEQIEIDVSCDDVSFITFYFEKMYGLRYENSSDWVCTGSVEHKDKTLL